MVVLGGAGARGAERTEAAGNDDVQGGVQYADQQSGEGEEEK